jgi:hypothetical protein
MISELLQIIGIAQKGAELESSPGGLPLREVWLPEGDRGARKFVKIMGQEARRALRNPLTLESAASIMGGAGSCLDQVGRLREWLGGHLEFFPDPEATELLRTPDYVLSLIWRDGIARCDCDEVGTLAAALGMAAGFPARLTLVSFGKSLPFTHVFCELHTFKAGWVELDVMRPAELPPGLTFARLEHHEV